MLTTVVSPVRKMLLVFTLVVAALSASLTVASSASASTGILVLSPTSGTPGTSVVAQGSGFERRTAGALNFDGRKIADFRTGRTGKFSVTFSVPTGEARTVVVQAATAATTATAAFVVTAQAATPALPTRLGDLNLGDFSQWDLGGPSAYPSTSKVAVDTGSVYEGSYAAKAQVAAGSGNKYARTLWGNSSGQTGALNYGEGKDFWYGTALYLPAGFHSSMQSYFVPMRWDNYGVSNVSRSGLAMYGDGSIRLFRERDGVERQANLLGSTTFRLAEGTWHWLEVHQTLSATDGKALNEVYVNGQLIGKSTARNYYGEPVGAMRFGIVALDGSLQTEALSLSYDRATLSDTQIGPVKR